MPLTLTADDILAIYQLYARYAHTIDLGDAAGCAACFTEDGSFQGASGSITTGHDALVKMAERHHTTRQEMHFYANLVVEPDGPGAKASCYNLRVNRGAGAAPTLAAFGVMQDALVRTSDGWRFRTRRSVALS